MGKSEWEDLLDRILMTRHRLLFTIFWTTVFLMGCAWAIVNSVGG